MRYGAYGRAVVRWRMHASPKKPGIHPTSRRADEPVSFFEVAIEPLIDCLRLIDEKFKPVITALLEAV